MKYIDAEKLYEKVDALMAHYAKAEKEMEDDAELSIFYQGKRKTCSEIINLITSLQQEQPEVDLEKFTEKIKTFQGRYKHPEIVSIKGAMAFMARLFYQYPNVARQWYEQLPKATMD